MRLLALAALGLAVTACSMAPTAPVVRSTPSARGSFDPRSQYGGSEVVYAEIAAETDCDTLQVIFDTAGGPGAPGGPAEHRWNIGYIFAADARMQEIGCY